MAIRARLRFPRIGADAASRNTYIDRGVRKRWVLRMGRMRFDPQAILLMASDGRSLGSRWPVGAGVWTRCLMTMFVRSAGSSQYNIRPTRSQPIARLSWRQNAMLPPTLAC